MAWPVIVISCLIVSGRSGGRGDHAGAGRRGKNGPAVGQQRAAVVEDHHAIAQEAPALLGMAGPDPGTAAIVGQGTGAWGPMRALLFPGLPGGPEGLNGCHVTPAREGAAGRYPGAMMLSISARSPWLRSRSRAPRLSSRWAGVREPTMATCTAGWASTQATASWAVVAPRSAAKRRSAATCKLCWNPGPVN